MSDRRSIEHAEGDKGTAFEATRGPDNSAGTIQKTRLEIVTGVMRIKKGVGMTAVGTPISIKKTAAARTLTIPNFKRLRFNIPTSVSTISTLFPRRKRSVPRLRSRSDTRPPNFRSRLCSGTSPLFVWPGPARDLLSHDSRRIFPCAGIWSSRAITDRQRGSVTA